MDIDEIENGLNDVMTKLGNALKSGKQIRNVVNVYRNELTNMQADHEELVNVINNLDGNTGYGATVDEEVNQLRLGKAIALRTQRLIAFQALQDILDTITEF